MLEDIPKQPKICSLQVNDISWTESDNKGTSGSLCSRNESPYAETPNATKDYMATNNAVTVEDSRSFCIISNRE